MGNTISRRWRRFLESISPGNTQFLALCPLCAAMYNEFMKHDEGAMESLKNTLMSSEDVEVPVQLGELDTSIRFVGSHRRDIRTILQEIG